MTVTDSIKRQIILKAPRSRVWRALSDVQEFGSWFGIATDSPSFEPGATVTARFTIKGYEHVGFKMVIDRVEPERLFSYRWHPYAVDPDVDYSNDPMTLVTFELADTDGGTMLTVVESGFDALPPERIQDAFRMNNQGWDEQIQNIDRHVSAA